MLWVGKPGKSPVEPNLKRKPYKIRKVTDRKREPKKTGTTKAKTADSTAIAAKKPRSKSKSATASIEPAHT